MMIPSPVHSTILLVGSAILASSAFACSTDAGEGRQSLGDATTGGALAVTGAGGGSSAASGAAGASVCTAGSCNGGSTNGGASNSAGGTTTSSGGLPSAGGVMAAGGMPIGDASVATTGGSGGLDGTSGAGGASTVRCDDPSLVWKTANKTNYTSYPAPGSPECIQYNGCTWAGMFAACSGKMPESWVASHNIVALFPLGNYADHDLCLRARGANDIVVTAIDTCGDSDCNGCCTQNKGTADALVDIESYTDARWGVPDGPIEWADLGLNPNACN